MTELIYNAYSIDDVSVFIYCTKQFDVRSPLNILLEFPNVNGDVQFRFSLQKLN